MKHFFLLITILLSIHCNGQTPIGYLPKPNSSGILTSAYSPVSYDNWYKNLEKYWYYRYRLVNDFLLIGLEEGMSIPAQKRNFGDKNPGTNPAGWSGNNNMLEWQDATIDLGHYISTLATEYAQLNNNGWDETRTLEELQNAQNALERLCENSAYYYADDTKYPSIDKHTTSLIGSSSSGFFLRDDVPILTMIKSPSYSSVSDKNHAHFNRTGLMSSYGSDPITLKPYKQVDEIFGCFSSSYRGTNYGGSGYAIPKDLHPRTYPDCESQDQLTEIASGEALMSKFLIGDPLGLQTQAQDGLHRLVAWTSNPVTFGIFGIHHRYISIPDPTTSWGCAMGNCFDPGLFFPNACPATHATYNWAGTHNHAASAGLMAWADVPTSGFIFDAESILTAGLAIPSVPPWTDYPMIFEFMQTLSSGCDNGYDGPHLLFSIQIKHSDIAFTDNWVAYSNDWVFWVPPIPIPVGLTWLGGLGGRIFKPGMKLSPIYKYYTIVNSAAWALNYANFVGATTSSSAPSSPYYGPGINTSWAHIKKHSEEDLFGTPHIPLIYELNYGDRSWSKNGDIETLLNSAPPCGTFNYAHSSFASSRRSATWEWSGNDRLSEPYHRVSNGTCYSGTGEDDEYNGLDYMELFNLYSLQRGDAEASGLCPGCSYLKGMINPYYCVGYQVSYPDAYGYGSGSNRLKLNWLEFFSIRSHVYGGTGSAQGWLACRSAKQIDLLPNDPATGKPGFQADYGSFFQARVKDYDCAGGDDGTDGPYNFATLNPVAPYFIHMRTDSTLDTIKVEKGKDVPIMYLPNGLGYKAVRYSADPEPGWQKVDSFFSVPENEELLKTFYKYMTATFVKDTLMLEYVKAMYGWNDDSLAEYKLDLALAFDSTTVKLYPNPANNSLAYLEYQTNEPGTVQVLLTNTIGQNISGFVEPYDHTIEPGTHKITIHAEKLTPGIYYCSISLNGQIITKKLVVTN